MIIQHDIILKKKYIKLFFYVKLLQNVFYELEWWKKSINTKYTSTNTSIFMQ